jgi:prolyl 4-hydroxylase
MAVNAAIQTAEALLAEGQLAAAAGVLEKASTQGEVDAIFLLATWSLVGAALPRDLTKARALLRRASDIGHVDAALMEIALTANGSGALASWENALEQLQVAAKVDPLAEEHLTLLKAMDLASNGEPMTRHQGVLIGTKPDVTLFRSFLSPAECAQLATVARDLLEPAQIVDPVTGVHRLDPVRTSLGAVIGPTRENLVIAAINRRMAAISDSAWDQGESLSILCYQPGQQYRPHHDGLPGVANQRIKTLIVYLNEGYEGGETQFLASGLRVEGRAGDAILFSNVDADGSIDPLSRHAGLPVTNGNKWIATRWIRQHRHGPWNQA